MPISRIGKIYVKTLSAAWEQILTPANTKAILGFKSRVRITPGKAPGFFDIAFSATPDETGNVTDGTGYLSYSGAGFGDAFKPSSGVWARTRSTGTVILETITFG